MRSAELEIILRRELGGASENSEEGLLFATGVRPLWSLAGGAQGAATGCFLRGSATGGGVGGLGGSGQGGALVDVSKPLHQGGTLQEEASFGVHSASYWLLPPSTCRVFHCVYTLPRMDELQSSG